MKLCKAAVYVCQNHLRQWATNYRVWCVAVLLLVILHINTKELRDFVMVTDTKISPYLLPFFFTQSYNRLLFLIPLVFLFCDAPFIDISQPYHVIRAGKRAWCAGQMLYIAVTSALYFLFLAVSSVVVNLPYISFETDWGFAVNTLCKTSAGADFGVKLFFPASIPQYFSPFQAMWFSFLLLTISGIFLGLLILCLNIYSESRAVGAIAACAFLLFDAVTIEQNALRWFSPVSWNDIATVAIGDVTYLPGFTYIIIGYTLLISFLITCSVIRIRKRNIQVLLPV